MAYVRVEMIAKHNRPARLNVQRAVAEVFPLVGQRLLHLAYAARGLPVEADKRVMASGGVVIAGVHDIERLQAVDDKLRRIAGGREREAEIRTPAAVVLKILQHAARIDMEMSVARFHAVAVGADFDDARIIVRAVDAGSEGGRQCASCDGMYLGVIAGKVVFAVDAEDSRVGRGKGRVDGEFARGDHGREGIGRLEVVAVRAAIEVDIDVRIGEVDAAAAGLFGEKQIRGARAVFHIDTAHVAFHAQGKAFRSRKRKEGVGAGAVCACDRDGTGAGAEGHAGYPRLVGDTVAYIQAGVVAQLYGGVEFVSARHGIDNPASDLVEHDL